MDRTDRRCTALAVATALLLVSAVGVVQVRDVPDQAVSLEAGGRRPAAPAVGWGPRGSVTTSTEAAATTESPATTTPDTAPATAPPVTVPPAPVTPRRASPTTAPPPPTVAPAPAPTTTAAPPSPPTTAPGLLGGLLSPAVQSEMLGQVNARRAAGTTCGGAHHGPVPPLGLHGTLSRAADLHALDMATLGYFSHTGANGSDPGSRISAVGYLWSAWAENIAAGQPTPSSVVEAWFHSAGHCANFMSTAITQVGFGHALAPLGPYPTYWVAKLGRPR